MPRSKGVVVERVLVKVRFPVLVSARLPLPLNRSVMVRSVVWLNCRVPFALMAPVTLAPSLRITVSPGSIVPPA